MFKKTDAYLILGGDNRFYFTGFRSSAGCAIVTPEDKYLLIDARYSAEARRNVTDVNVVTSSAATLYEDAAKLLKKLGAKNVGYEDDYVTVSEFKRIKGSMEGFTFKAASSEIAVARMVKTEDEIKKIAEAEIVTQKALHKALSILKYGVTEKDFSNELTYQMLAFGADGLAFDNIVAFGVNTATPHHKPTMKKLEKNDMVTVDIGACVNGYCGDMTRSFCMGTPPEKLGKIYNIVLAAQEYALGNIKAGMTGREAHLLASEYITAHGYGEEFSHSLGHGIGINVHEYPYLSLRSDEVLRENMVVSVEPGIYVDGFGGVRIEDIVVIKEDGIQNLTEFTKSISL